MTCEVCFLLKLKYLIIILFAVGTPCWCRKLVSIDKDVANHCLESFGNGIDHVGYVSGVDLRHIVGFLRDRIGIC